MNRKLTLVIWRTNPPETGMLYVDSSVRWKLIEETTQKTHKADISPAVYATRIGKIK